jgi:hypothetical protein
MGDEWLVSGDKVDVDINGLRSFAEAVKKEMETVFRPSFEAGIKPMMRVRAPFATGNLNEGNWFNYRHMDSVEAILALCAEVQLGFAALQAASMSIANEYVSGDALAQATHQDVDEAFAPLAGNQTLQGLLEQAKGNNTADVGGGETVPIPAGADDPTRYDDVGDGGDAPGDISGGDRPGIYDGSTVGSGAGQYNIGADDDGTWDKEVDPGNRR